MASKQKPKAPAIRSMKQLLAMSGKMSTSTIALHVQRLTGVRMAPKNM